MQFRISAFFFNFDAVYFVPLLYRNVPSSRPTTPPVFTLPDTSASFVHPLIWIVPFLLFRFAYPIIPPIPYASVCFTELGRTASSFPSIVRFDTVPELNVCIVPFSYFARTPTNIPTPSVSLLSDTFAFDTSTFTFASTVFEFCFVLVTAISVSLPSLRPARIPTPLSDLQFPALSFSPF